MAIIYNRCEASQDVSGKDMTWYNSTNVIYSEALSLHLHQTNESVFPTYREDERTDVRLVFHHGGTYLYKNVLVEDYLMFKHALCTDKKESSGQAFIKYIKPYEFVKEEKTNLKVLSEQMDSFKTSILQESPHLISQ